MNAQANVPPNHTIYINNLNEKIKKDELKKSLYAIFSQVLLSSPHLYLAISHFNNPSTHPECFFLAFSYQYFYPPVFNFSRVHATL